MRPQSSAVWRLWPWRSFRSGRIVTTGKTGLAGTNGGSIKCKKFATRKRARSGIANWRVRRLAGHKQRRGLPTTSPLIQEGARMRLHSRERDVRPLLKKRKKKTRQKPTPKPCPRCLRRNEIDRVTRYRLECALGATEYAHLLEPLTPGFAMQSAIGGELEFDRLLIRPTDFIDVLMEMLRDKVTEIHRLNDALNYTRAEADRYHDLFARRGEEMKGYAAECKSAAESIMGPMPTIPDINEKNKQEIPMKNKMMKHENSESAMEANTERMKEQGTKTPKMTKMQQGQKHPATKTAPKKK